MTLLPSSGCTRKRFAVEPAWDCYLARNRGSAGCSSRPILPTICARSTLRLGKRCE